MKRFLSGMIAFSIAISNLGCFNVAQAKEAATPELAENQAYALMYETPKLTRFAKVEMGESRDVRTVTKDGETIWNIDVTNGNKSYQMNFDLADSFAKDVVDGSVFEIEIEYWDEAVGYVQLSYDAKDKSHKYSDYLATWGDKRWRKHTVVLEDAFFGNRLDEKYDFQLSAKAPHSKGSQTSAASVAIRSVKVTRHTAKNPIIHKGWTDESGNAFEFYKKEKILKNEFKNTLDKDVNATVTYRAIDSNGVERWRKSESVSLAPQEVKQTEVNLDIDYCQLYTLYVDIKDEQNGINENLKRYDFAILKTDPDGIQNKKHYINYHTERHGDYLESGYQMLKKSNTYGYRIQIGWYECEPVDGTYVMPENFQKDLELMQKYGVHAMWMLYACPSFHTGGWNWIPRGETALKAFERYLRWKVQYLKDNSGGMIDRFEFWNEPNIRLFNGGGEPILSIDVEVSPEEYVPAAKVAYEVVKDIYPEMKMGVLSICDIPNNNSYSWLTRSMDAGLGNYCDAITLHPYGVADDAKLADVMKKYKKYADDMYGADFEVWSTEVGYTKIDKNIKTDERQKDYSVRAYLYYLGEGVGDAFFTYTMEQKGEQPIEREDFYGTTTPSDESARDRWGTAFIPRKSFVALTGMNYITALADGDEKGDYCEDENTYIYKLDSEKFDTNILTIWNNVGSSDITLNLGEKEIKYSDEYGNMYTMSSDDGIYTLHATETPFYLLGDFDKFTKSDVAKISWPEGTVTAAVKDMAKFDISVSDELSDCTLEFEIPADSQLAETPVLKDGKAEVKLLLGDSIKEDFFVRAFVKKGDNIIGVADVDIGLKELKADMIMNVSLKNMIDMNQWKAVANITNYSEKDVITGKIKFSAPDFLAEMKPIDIGRIPRGKTSEVKFDLPSITQKGIYNTSYIVELDSGEVYENTKRIDFAVSKYKDSEIKIDGTLEPGEWDDSSWMYAKGVDNIWFYADKNRYGGDEDCSGRATTSWDEENFYFAAEITDNVHFNNIDHSVSYQCDNIQFTLYHDINGYVAAGQAGTRFHEISIARNEENSGLWRTNIQTDAVKIGTVAGEGVECAVVRGDGVTYYETKIPWKVIMGYDFVPEAGNYVAFAYAINDNDGFGRAWAVSYAGGIVGGKNSAMFSKLQFVKEE